MLGDPRDPSKISEEEIQESPTHENEIESQNDAHLTQEPEEHEVAHGEDQEADQSHEQENEYRQGNNRSKKRIKKLLKQKEDQKINYENEISNLKYQISQLSNREIQRTAKETDQDFQSRLNQMQSQKRKAYEDGDYDKVSELDLNMMTLARQMPAQQQQAPPYYPPNQVPSQYNPNNQSAFDSEGYFSSRNSWYASDDRMRAYAQVESQKMTNDPYWQSRAPQEMLDEVSRRTVEKFKSNPYQNSAPTEGMTYQRPPKNDVTVTDADLRLMRSMMPDLSIEQARKKAKEYKQRILKGAR